MRLVAIPLCPECGEPALKWWVDMPHAEIVTVAAGLRAKLVEDLPVKAACRHTHEWFLNNDDKGEQTR